MKKIIFLLALIGTVIACSSGDSGGDNSGGKNYDRGALLTNWADNIIIPSYENYQSKVATLSTDAANFTASPTTTTLQTLRTSWYEAYKAYQYVAIYGFGKALDVNLKEIANTFPTSKTGIEDNITSGTYNLSLQAQYAKQGLPALDYLLNGLGADDATIVTFYTTNAKASNYKKYLVDVTGKLKTTIDAVVTDWKSGGYRAAYIANTGTSVSGAVNVTTNNFVKNLEKDIRTLKLGIPAGVDSEGVKFPEKTEALYKGNASTELLNISLKASQDFFNGKHFNSTTTGESLKTYLDFVNATADGKKLSEIINTQYAAVFTASNSLNASLADQINTDNTKVITAYKVLQLTVGSTKLNMLQALNITIDYVDGDGD
ncbi:putative lipoprotein [Flavobacterium sp. 90]|uniref:imelysin family protein n=1 Tax=unclassified Flavobacterium TaxID=196869 RepID=UPI000EACDBEC|nr:MULTISPECIES: imelysin family protein [unclassified Flavobacterium]RKR10281.1 putative lipoprotein [Flavobacterium sp. 81]TCK54066.1 putative lipoprotein [Flavobacterium sp. 90]